MPSQINSPYKILNQIRTIFSSIYTPSVSPHRTWWRFIVARFKPGGFLRNVAIVSTGTAIAQGIQVLASPVLTRLYSPADFGIFSVYLSAVPILTIISTLQYSMAIVLPKEDKDAKALLGMVVKIAAALTLFFLAIAFALKFIGLQRFGLKEIPWVILPVIVLATFVNMLSETLNNWNIRTKSFVLITTALVSSAVCAVLLSIGLRVLAAGWWGLVAGMLLGKIVNLFVQLFYGDRLRVVRDSLAVSNDRGYASAVLKDYSDFPKYRLPQNLLNSLSLNLPAIIFVTFFGPATGGFFALARRVIALPSALISEAVRKVFYQKAADLKNKGGGLFDATLKATLGLATVGLIPFGTIVLFGPTLFSVIFGHQWRTAGLYASWLALWMYFAFCNNPAQAAIPVIRFQKQFLIYEIILFATRILALGVGGIAHKHELAIVLFAVSGAALNLYLIVLVLTQLYRSQ